MQEDDGTPCPTSLWAIWGSRMASRRHRQGSLARMPFSLVRCSSLKNQQFTIHYYLCLRPADWPISHCAG
jgi:hypothetical protein